MPRAIDGSNRNRRAPAGLERARVNGGASCSRRGIRLRMCGLHLLSTFRERVMPSATARWTAGAFWPATEGGSRTQRRGGSGQRKMLQPDTLLTPARPLEADVFQRLRTPNPCENERRFPREGWQPVCTPQDQQVFRDVRRFPPCDRSSRLQQAFRSWPQARQRQMVSGSASVFPCLRHRRLSSRLPARRSSSWLRPSSRWSRARRYSMRPAPA